MLTRFLPGGTFVRAGAAVAVAAAAYASAPAVSAQLAAPAQARTSASAAKPFPAAFIAIAAVAPSRLAVFSAVTGHRLKYLTSPQPGGGVNAPVLSANGRIVAFERGLGTCAVRIDTVPAKGGRERVLVPLVNSGKQTTVAIAPSFSADGRYLLYDTFNCVGSSHARIHLRNLATGHEVTSSRATVPAGAVFVNNNRQIAYAGSGGNLVVRQVPAFTIRRFAPPHTCGYEELAGTETRLVAVLRCGNLNNLSLAAVSLRTFTVTRTLNRLGPCLTSRDLSLATGDPTAMLIETYGCSPPSAAHARILKIRDHIIRLIRSGKRTTTPRDVLW